MVNQVSGFSLFSEIFHVAHFPFFVVGIALLFVRYARKSSTAARLDEENFEGAGAGQLRPFELSPLGPNRIWVLVAWASIFTTALIVAGLGYRYQSDEDSSTFFQLLSSWAFSIPISVFLFALLVPKLELRYSKRMARHKQLVAAWVLETYGFTLTPKQSRRLSTWSYSQNHAKSKTTSSVSRTVRINASDFDRRMMLIVDLAGTPYLGWRGLWKQEFTPLPASSGLRPRKRL